MVVDRHYFLRINSFYGFSCVLFVYVLFVYVLFAFYAVYACDAHQYFERSSQEYPY